METLIFENKSYRVYKANSYEDVRKCDNDAGWWNKFIGTPEDYNAYVNDGVKDFYFIKDVKYNYVRCIYLDYGTLEENKKHHVFQTFAYGNNASGVNCKFHPDYFVAYSSTTLDENYLYGSIRKNVFSKFPQAVLNILPHINEMYEDEIKLNKENEESIAKEKARSFDNGTLRYYDDTSYQLIAVLNNEIENVIIDKSATCVKADMFGHLYSLKSVVFEEGSNCSIIDKFAFVNTKISSIKIPKSVEIIKENAFLNCDILNAVEFEEDSKLTAISYGAFSNTKASYIKIPKSIKQLNVDGICESYRTIEFEDLSNVELVAEYCSTFVNNRRIKNLVLPKEATSSDLNICGVMKVSGDGSIKIKGKYRPEIFKHALISKNQTIEWLDENIMEKAEKYNVWDCYIA